ncbi:unnamed protein product [Vitrella brassicaformis CCMP3155]|uniref:S-adenosylmethionine-dependent methyltransferase domain-containing protein n=1 Tax=Vitrella brassicaformis (strain CCMP3155) TaxID=1169540 RepID=A0A0G4FQ64_VITBC|nr:unnamed protein product [Vitrella brassicaformis CCMP3155]|eukprot:CEM16577.1 unnamed protein product [Vitrella brassicaformis CCMP3155]
MLTGTCVSSRLGGPHLIVSARRASIRPIATVEATRHGSPYPPKEDAAPTHKHRPSSGVVQQAAAEALAAIRRQQLDQRAICSSAEESDALAAAQQQSAWHIDLPPSDLSLAELPVWLSAAVRGLVCRYFAFPAGRAPLEWREAQRHVCVVCVRREGDHEKLASAVGRYPNHWEEGSPVVRAPAVRRVAWCALTGPSSVHIRTAPVSAPPGCLAVAVDGRGEVLGWGFWNPLSVFRVRLMAMGAASSASDTMDVHTMMHDKIRRARNVRKKCIPAVGHGRQQCSAVLACAYCVLFVTPQRRLCLGLPCEGVTDAYRLVNVEGDGLSGLCVDVYARHVVVRPSALWTEIWRPEIHHALRSQLSRPLSRGDTDAHHEGSRPAVWWRRSMGQLKVDGWQPKRGDHTPAANQGPSGASDGSPVCICEGGLRYEVSPWRGQKTGWFIDMRDNRLMVRDLFSRLLDRISGEHKRSWRDVSQRHHTQWSAVRQCRGLDLFSYTGGFALNMAHAYQHHLATAQQQSSRPPPTPMAVSITAVDHSPEAIATLHRNAQLNGLEGHVRAVQSDVMEYVCREGEAGGVYDLVVCDPPKRANVGGTSAWEEGGGVGEAVEQLVHLNAAVIKLVRSEGLLLTCTCSQVVTHSGAFLDVLKLAAQQANRQLCVVRELHASGDHPRDPFYAESEYLTGYLLSVR